MTSLPSPRYIRSVKVLNNSNDKYTLVITYVKDNKKINTYNTICKNTNQQCEYPYTSGSATFVYPITNVSLITNKNCGLQNLVYEISSEKIDSVKNLDILITATNQIITNLK